MERPNATELRAGGVGAPSKHTLAVCLALWVRVIWCIFIPVAKCRLQIQIINIISSVSKQSDRINLIQILRLQAVLTLESNLLWSPSRFCLIRCPIKSHLSL